ncbi:MFS transporter [Longispora albida]|uniref:MFS transporter n=1 Tax=Longispora albida TaxID=203523 RepID=UPI00036AA850|nr:MFS transporter [Longispora albida]
MSDQPRSTTSDQEESVAAPAPAPPPPRPATYRDVFSSREYRGLFMASGLSWFGDYAARAAITALVYAKTGSVPASAAAFALSYLPWLLGGPVLAALADRYPYRKVMIICDLARMGLVAVVAVPDMPVPVMFALLMATAMLNPPFEAARSALLPKMVAPDRYVLSVGALGSLGQAAQIAGYVGGAALSLASPHLTLAFNAVTFGISALLLAVFVVPRPAALASEQRRTILRETGEGISIVFSRPVTRAVATIVFTALTFVAVPEGLAAGWAAALNRGELAQGLIMAAAPAGLIAGGLLIPRLVPPAARQKLIRPLVIIAPVVLVPALLEPPLPVVLVMVFVVGFAFGAFTPILNGMFVQVLPSSHRARAFGVMNTGTQLSQGLGLLAAAGLTQYFRVPFVIGGWCAAGAVAMVVASAVWPSAEVIDAEIAQTQAANDAAAKLAG